MGGIVAMSSTINASTASGGGVITSADASGILQLQTGGTTALTIDASQNVTFAKSILTSATAQASTSGTSIDFTGIPSWVKRITVMLSGVSTNGTSSLLFQIGTSSGIENSGYISSGSYQGSSTAGTTSTAGFLNQAGGAILDTICGTTSIVSFGSNKWVSSSVSSTGTSNYTYIGAGAKTLSGTLDRVRITTVNGTDAFDAGSINIMYE